MAIGVVTLPAQASATQVPVSRAQAEAEPAPEEPTLVGDAEMGIFAESRPDQDVAAVSPQVRLGMRPRPEVELDLRFGAVSTFRNGPQGRQQDARPSNLSFGASRVVDARGDRWRYAKLGFSFVLPTAYAGTPSEHEAYDYALGGRVGWDPWSWTPKTFGLVLPAEVRAQLGRRWVLGGDGGVAVLLPSADRTDGLAFAAQIAGEARLVTRWMGLGMRLMAVWNGRHPDDRSQVGVSPFADVSLCRRSTGRRIRGERTRTSNECPVYASGRVNINLDGPYGWSGEEAMRVWGLQVGLGWSVF
ncbi:hypothetical protein [Paraliomyxa miuraensis]|uniref:hypothetical protein n=1 Tax=Paraliomyxa miuraensis TaxID=376150 RepID=UPI00224D68FC|nr:hypothetical protein [Paraliomyxa miuraensis]MCX4247358.1 hypothetical protein [Paraliomyxa miuraensis]